MLDYLIVVSKKIPVRWRAEKMQSMYLSHHLFPKQNYLNPIDLDSTSLT